LTDTLPETLKEIEGELRSQQTDGWGTLVNTASSRMYLKKMNRECEKLLEKVAEPLSAFSHMLGEDAQKDQLRYAWKTLMRKDRKSTRLNSSHVSISYAVFCLKEKSR